MKERVTVSLEKELLDRIRQSAKKGHRPVSSEFEMALIRLYMPELEEKEATAA